MATHSLHSVHPMNMTEPDRAELQRIAQLVEVNRDRLQALEQQVRNLEGIKLEQEHALEALQSISSEGANGAMIPLGQEFSSLLTFLLTEEP